MASCKGIVLIQIFSTLSNLKLELPCPPAASPETLRDAADRKVLHPRLNAKSCYPVNCSEYRLLARAWLCNSIIHGAASASQVVLRFA